MNSPSLNSARTGMDHARPTWVREHPAEPSRDTVAPADAAGFATPHRRAWQTLQCMGLISILGVLIIGLSLGLAGTTGMTTSTSLDPRAPEVVTMDLPFISNTSAVLLLQCMCATVLVVVALVVVGRDWLELTAPFSSASMDVLARSPKATAGGQSDRLADIGTSRDVPAVQEMASTKTVDAEAALAARHAISMSCVHQVAEHLVGTPVSAFSLHKAIGALSEALDAERVGLRLSDRTTSALRCETLLTIGGVPMALADTGETVEASTYVALHRAGDGRSVRCLSVPLRRGEETIGVLAVEGSESYWFDESRIKLTQTVAMLMALALSGVSQGQEERRGALLAERAAIARELHDSLAQSLAFLKIQVAQMQVTLRDVPASDPAVLLALQLRQGISRAYMQVKELISAFRVRMGTRGLGQALEEAVEEFSHKGGFAIALDYRLHDCKLSVNEEFHVLQVIREALSNTVRHARASRVNVTLSHQPGGLVTATVEDDGRGFTSNVDRPTHYGLTIMRERASSLRGQLTVNGGEERGTVVRLEFSPESTSAPVSGRAIA